MSEIALNYNFAVKMAHEGIPVAAIARIVHQPMDEIYELLHTALGSGQITEIPKPDWPPTARNVDRVPTITRKTSDDDVMFICRKIFKLTKLEAGFLVLLLKLDHADKAKLHNVIEQQRLERHDQPDTMEMTDQKMVDVMICKLRKKLRVLDPEFIITTVWGGGYYIEAPVKEKIYARLAVEGVACAAVDRPSDIHAGDPGCDGR